METGEPEYWITQRLTHFDPLEQRTFQQRYFYNTDYAKQDSTLNFLYICGEGTLTRLNKIHKVRNCITFWILIIVYFIILLFLY